MVIGLAVGLAVSAASGAQGAKEGGAPGAIMGVIDNLPGPWAIVGVVKKIAQLVVIKTKGTAPSPQALAWLEKRVKASPAPAAAFVRGLQERYGNARVVLGELAKADVGGTGSQWDPRWKDLLAPSPAWMACYERAETRQGDPARYAREVAWSAAYLEQFLAKGGKVGLAFREADVEKHLSVLRCHLGAAL